MKFLCTTTAIALLSISSTFAFDSVTEVLPSGKILICKNADQVRSGESVENHKRSDAKSSSDFSMEKASEFKLPKVGQKLKLTHKDFHSKGKHSVYHTEELGTAIVSGESLEGEERFSYSLDKSRHSRRVETKSKISKDEAMEIAQNCLVAIPENGLKLKERASVSWE